MGMDGPNGAPVVPAAHGYNQLPCTLSLLLLRGLVGSIGMGGAWDPQPAAEQMAPPAETFPTETRDCKRGFAAVVPFAACLLYY